MYTTDLIATYINATAFFF